MECYCYSVNYSDSSATSSLGGDGGGGENDFGLSCIRATEPRVTRRLGEHDNESVTSLHVEVMRWRLSSFCTGDTCGVESRPFEVARARAEVFFEGTVAVLGVEVGTWAARFKPDNVRRTTSVLFFFSRPLIGCFLSAVAPLLLLLLVFVSRRNESRCFTTTFDLIGETGNLLQLRVFSAFIATVLTVFERSFDDVVTFW